MNKILLLGRLTKDPDTKFLQNNSLMVVNFTLAVNRKRTKQAEEQETDFIDILAFGKTAEFIQKYYKKGIQVVIVGRLQKRIWEDKDGKRHYSTEVITEETYFADSKKNSDSAMNNISSSLTDGVSFENDNVANDDDLPF